MLRFAHSFALEETRRDSRAFKGKTNRAMIVDEGLIVDRNIQFRINSDDMERRILCTSYDEEYDALIKRLETISRDFKIPLLRDAAALPELMKWIPYLVLYGREDKNLVSAALRKAMGKSK